MNFFLCTIVVGIIGWGASLMMTGESSGRTYLHLLLGVLGAVFGEWLMSLPARAGKIAVDDFSVLSLLASFFIALALSMIANLWERATAHPEAEIDF